MALLVVGVNRDELRKGLDHGPCVAGGEGVTSNCHRCLAEQAAQGLLLDVESQTDSKTGSADRVRVQRSSKRRSAARTQADHPCECGCDTLVRRRFAPGHAAKLRAQRKREDRLISQLLV